LSKFAPRGAGDDFEKKRCPAPWARRSEVLRKEGENLSGVASGGCGQGKKGAEAGKSLKGKRLTGVDR